MVVIWKLAIYSILMAALVFCTTHHVAKQLESGKNNMTMVIFYMVWIGILDYCILFVHRLPAELRLFVLIPLSTTLCFRILYLVFC